jgi:hypothetical protein
MKQIYVHPHPMGNFHKGEQLKAGVSFVEWTARLCPLSTRLLPFHNLNLQRKERKGHFKVENVTSRQLLVQMN